MSNAEEPMTNDTLDGSYNYGVLSVLQVLSGFIYEKSTPQERQYLKEQLARAKANPIAKWNRKEEIDFFETPFEAVESTIKGIDDHVATHAKG
ncbi:hypothetical protein EJA70_24570 [Pseudomonas sp. PB103]|uniref:hypothetical protein n=1 Tax=Pseudomonas sp. PB103 TaxID=2494698 RepID=UPI00131BDA67|nr:hypothetical protein [Pseudomonas sp. PB103]KAE9640673.1 hypothetical protein EJA70_24570 [Pseudomonas sp. PB103]